MKSKKNKIIQGKAYFAVDKRAKAEKIAYKPENKVLMTWKVK
ncbi:hypothetical protein [Listeria floridensis]|nr:hypothetical protein [Listeria floridensis]